MAFVVENGTGVKGANSYVTVQEFRDYHELRGRDTTAITNAQVQAALVLATDYVDYRWGPSFLGSRRFPTLASRAVLTLTSLPADGDQVAFGAQTYVFRTTPVLDTDVEIGTTRIATLVALLAVLATTSNNDFSGGEFADTDVAALTVFGTDDGVPVSFVGAAGSWDVAQTAGRSAQPQSLEFPRASLNDRAGNAVAGIPPQLKEATSEYAWRAKDTSLAPDPEVAASGQRVTGQRERVGPIETETTYSAWSVGTGLRPYPAADRLLSEFVRGTGGVVRA